MQPIALNIPDDLARLDRWVVWRYINGRKVPFVALDNIPAKSTNPADWAPLATAKRALQRHEYAGLGFVFAEGDGLVGVDLDDCFEFTADVLETMVLKPWAAPLVGALGATYMEVSPSGTGLKAWCRGTISKALKVPITWDGEPAGAIEVYCRGRYFTFTGYRYDNCPLEVTDCQTVLDYIYETVAPQRNTGEPPSYPAKFPNGTQHNNVVRIIGALRWHNVCEEAIESCLQVVNLRQSEQPCPPEHIREIIQSTRRWEDTNG